MSRPNILFLFSDQQRHDTLGCYNENIDFTPNIDRLAERGVRFENAYTCQPVCGPARACLQTGVYATRLGCYRNNIALPQNVTTIADHFNQNGYDTAYIGKWHLASTGGDSNEGIGERQDYRTKPIPLELRGGYRDYWLASDVLELTSNGYGGYMFDKDGKKVDFMGYRADCLTDFAIDYISNRDGEKPFFLFLSYLEPHHQNDIGHYQGPYGSKNKFKDYDIPDDLRCLNGDYNEEYPDYLGCCESLDMNVGRLIKTLEKQGVLENTVIVYTSDHGSHFKTRNKEYKRSCHDSSIHIPLIISGGDFGGGKVVSDMVSLLDLPATLIDCGSIDLPKEMDSRPLTQLILGEGNWNQDVFVQISESQVGRAIRTKKWKYSIFAPDKNGWLDAGSDAYKEEFLYDLAADPNELDNLVKEDCYEDIRKELRQLLVQRMVEAGESAPVII